MKFVDEVEITVSSGRGGPGAISFRREAMEPRGGPDGGDGGRGGHVVFRVNPQINTLIDFRFRKKYAAANGDPGKGRNMTGSDGQDLILEVPPGTVVRDAETDEVLVDLSEPGDHVFLEGGRGGKGNWFFRTSVNQAPEKAQPGEAGEERALKLELKLIADVGVIGYPNAGKSTLISSISAAKPKIADYPFTTLAPNLGVVKANDDQSFVVADIPGLVPGAHEGVGLGTQFLRHIERTNLFVHLIDASGISGRDPWQDYLDINHELAAYDESKADEADYRPLASREQLVVLNKVDTLSEDDMLRLQDSFRHQGVATLAISAAARRGLKELVTEIARRVKK
ncbi:MAG TPA: GTPase ObgE [Pseudobdellovibrionaceae bacterium]|nr:GTPase ObgE [Pseudobdellovibrionaceae bacterium]